MTKAKVSVGKCENYEMQSMAKGRKQVKEILGKRNGESPLRVNCDLMELGENDVISSTVPSRKTMLTMSLPICRFLSNWNSRIRLINSFHGFETLFQRFERKCK